METQKGPYKDSVLLKGDYMGFHVSLGECKGSGFMVQGLGFAVTYR